MTAKVFVLRRQKVIYKIVFCVRACVWVSERTIVYYRMPPDLKHCIIHDKQQQQ